MKPTKINIKLLYQNPEMWIWYFITLIVMGLILIPQIQAPPSKNGLPWGVAAMPLLVLTIIGSALGRLVSDIWNRPTFFCIPGQIETSRHMLLLLGLVLAIIASLFKMLVFPIMDLNSQIVSIIMLVSFHLMIYWLSVITSIWFNRMAFLIPYAVFFIQPIIYDSGILDNNKWLLNHSWILIFIYLAISFLVYHAIGYKYLFRSIAAAPWAILFIEPKDSGNIKYEHAHIIKIPCVDRFLRFIHHFISERIQINNQSTISPHIWGRGYIILGSLIFNLKAILLTSVFVFFGVIKFINYHQMIELQTIFFSLLGVLGGQLCIISKSDILLPISRRTRFFSGVTALMTAMFTLFAFAAIFVILSSILPESIKSFINSGETHDFIPFNYRFIFLIAISLPMTGGLLILFQKKPSLSIAMTCILIFVLAIFLYIINVSAQVLNIDYIYLIIPSAVLSIGFYLFIIYYDSIKRSLI